MLYLRELMKDYKNELKGGNQSNRTLYLIIQFTGKYFFQKSWRPTGRRRARSSSTCGGSRRRRLRRDDLRRRRTPSNARRSPQSCALRPPTKCGSLTRLFALRFLLLLLLYYFASAAPVASNTGIHATLGFEKQRQRSGRNARQVRDMQTS